METPAPTMRDLARRLLAASQVAPDTPDTRIHIAVLTTQRMRNSLSRFAGADGFTSLLRRALMLARQEAPSLNNIKVGVDGSLMGFDTPAAQPEAGSKNSKEADEAAALAILANLFTLLATFIGEPLTLRLVRDAWPNVPLDDFNSRIEADR
jgi:hypothetical protein